jgi:hypothetical protein
MQMVLERLRWSYITQSVVVGAEGLMWLQGEALEPWIQTSIFLALVVIVSYFQPCSLCGAFGADCVKHW